MLLEQLRYKKYSIGELISMFATETVLCSRRISLADNDVKRMDRISVMAKKPEYASPKHYGVVVIKAVFFSNREEVTNWLLADGFAEESVNGCKALVREWRIAISQFQDSLALLAQIAKTVEEICRDLPLMLYSSRERKCLLDCLDILSASSTVPIHKISRKLLDALGPQQINGPAFLISQIGNREWISWSLGDDFAPVFATKQAAVSFAERRRRLLAPFSSVNISFYEPPVQSLYKLVDNKISLLERIHWLRHESARLERLLPIFDPRLERAE